MAKKKRRRRMTAKQLKYFGKRTARRVKRAVKSITRRRRSARRRARVVTRIVRRSIVKRRKSRGRRRRGPVGGVRRGFAFIPPTEQLVKVGGGALAGALVAEYVGPKVFKDATGWFNTSPFGGVAGQGLIGAAGFLALKKFAPAYAAPFFIGAVLFPLASLIWSKVNPNGVSGIRGLGDDMMPQLPEGGDMLQGGVYERSANNVFA